ISLYRVRTSALRWSRVSNSLAVWAKSSSSSGSSRSLTDFTSTVTVASSPAWSPPTSVVGKAAFSCAALFATDERVREAALLPRGEPGDRLVEPVEQRPLADLVAQALGREVVD